MAEGDQGEKTEEPTQQRREDFRKRGQVAQTKELASVMMLLSCLVMIWVLGRFFLENLSEVFTRSFGEYVVRAAREGEWRAAASFAVHQVITIVGPLLGLFWFIAFASNVVQIGFLVNEEALQFKPQRLNPVEGAKRLFSLKALMEGAKAVFKMSIVGAIAYLAIKSEIHTVPLLVTYSVEQIFVLLGDLLFKLMGGVIFFMAVLACIDFWFQRWDLEQKMKMTKQEVKEEQKSKEGDPQVKQRIRKVQKEMANKRMMEDVPNADAVVTNPTHLAVAIQYDQTMVAPQMVAKGAGEVAERIKEVARENDVPVIENKPLARTMYKTLEIGQTIPRELYEAVAEILTYVYRIKQRVNT